MNPFAPASTSRADGVVDDESLVLVPEDVAAPTSRRLLAWTLVVAFLTLSAGTGIYDRVSPEVPRPPAGREKIREDALRAAAHWSDGSRAALIERDIKLTSHVRAAVTPYYTVALLKLLHEADPDVVVGRENWIYLRGRAIPPRELSDEGMTENGAATLAAIQRRLGQMGIQMLAVPVPRKEVIAGEFMPDTIDVREQIEPMFIAALTRRGVRNVDLLPVFKAMKPNDVYYKYGSHWTQSAEVAAAEVVAKGLGMWREEPERRSVIKKLTGTVIETDMIDFLGARGATDNSFTDDGRSPVYLIAPAHRDQSLLPPASQDRVAVVGTSFTSQRRFPTFIQHFIGRPVMNAGEGGMDSIEAMRDLIQRRRNGILPDVMVVEMPEHLLFFPMPFTASAELFARLPSADGPKIAADQRWRKPDPPAGGAFELGGAWETIAVLPARAFAYSGNGEVAVVMRGSAQGDVVVQVRQPGSTPTCDWPASTNKLVMPLVSTQPASGPVTVVVRARDEKRASFQLDSIELIAFGDADNALELQSSPIDARDGAWSQSMKLDGAEPLPAFGVLWIELDPAARIQGPLDLNVELAGGAPAITAHFNGVDPGTSIAIDLHPAHDSQLERVVLSARGPAPAKAVAHARILPPEDALSHGERKPGRAAKKK